MLRGRLRGRLEGWAKYEYAKKSGLRRPLCCPPTRRLLRAFETRPYGPLLRVRLESKLAPMGEPLPGLAAGPIPEFAALERRRHHRVLYLD